MKLNILKITANINFFLIFPFYIFGQILVQIGYINPYLGSSFSFLLAVSIPLSIFGLLWVKDFYAVLKFNVTKFFLFFLFFYFLFLVFKYLNGAGIVFIVSHLKSLLRLVAIYLLSLNFHFSQILFDKKKYFLILSMSALLIILFSFDFVSISAVEIGGDYFEFDYQMIAFLILFLFINKVSLKYFDANLIVLLLMLTSLFFLGARTEFYISMMIFIFVGFLRLRNKFLTIIFSGLITFVFLVIGYIYIDREELSGIRIFAVLFDGEDASQVSRSSLTSNAIKTISTHPFLGDFGSHELGAYSHNLLSAWVDFGILGFAYLLLIVIFPFFQLIKRFKRENSHVYILAISSFVALVISFALAKTYNYSMLSVALAYYGVWALKRGDF
ncbi:hypothetical protein [Comamonas testosteroni]|uniref:hypothetical protein n=1 Tax=Comamonas testosteroni TaxID=285 RepID=UPI00391C6566